MFVIIGTMPFFYKGGLCYPCELSATSVKVDFKNGKAPKEQPTCFYTEEEIKQKLDIKLIDGWDIKTKKVVKKSNISVSSMISEKTKK